MRHLTRTTLAALLALSAGAAQAQPNVLELGTLWETINEGGNLVSSYANGGFLRWPGGFDDRSGSPGGFRANTAGPRLRFLLKDYLDWNDEETPFYEPSTPEGCLPPPAYRTIKYVRTPRTPTVVVDAAGEEHASTVETVGPTIVVAPNLIADEMVQQWTFYTNGLIARSRYYAWANPAHDDYVIREVTLFNTGNANCDPTREEESAVPMDELYIGYFSAIIHPNARGDAAASFADRGYLDGYIDYVGAGAGDSVRVLFGFDGDDPDTPGNDRGDPFPERFANDPVQNPKDLYAAGELVSAMYAGYGLLHADRAPRDRRDDPAQPFTTGSAEFATAAGWRKEENFRNLFAGGQRSHVARPNPAVPPVRNRVAGWMGVGPYSLQPGDSLRVVFVHAAGGPTAAKAKEVGAQWQRGQISDAAKDAFVAASRDSLLRNVGRAAWNWRTRLSQRQAIPMAPKPPRNLRIAGSKQRIELTWQASESAGVTAYRIYRKAGDYRGEMALVAEVPASQTSYTDEAVDLGVAYFYAVTASAGVVQGDPTAQGALLESSRFYNRSVHPARAFRGSLSRLDSVRVVPNPYNLAAARQFAGEEDRITFTNLTTRCTIRIFNVAGDLIKTLRHDDESAYEHWSPMLTDDNLFPASGVYLYHVTDEDTGEKTFGRFVIIR
ncbi:MAG TPA: fibronectin type III domain-containing protein [Rhodothermales bacterium]|nr:fibronectin type III domain-containing protein [Rhodothermales bacterium]